MRPTYDHSVLLKTPRAAWDAIFISKVTQLISLWRGVGGGRLPACFHSHHSFYQEGTGTFAMLRMVKWELREVSNLTVTNGQGRVELRFLDSEFQTGLHKVNTTKTANWIS